MTDEHEKRQRRNIVSNMYPGEAWKERVARMPTDQITAIYLRHLRDASKLVQRQPDNQDELRLF